MSEHATSATFERVGRLQVEEGQEYDEQGRTIGGWMWAPEVFRCTECSALVDEDGMSDHSDWHFPPPPSDRVSRLRHLSSRDRNQEEHQ